MKARSKAAKLRDKRGRPPMPANTREPNGRKSRRKKGVAMRQLENEAEIMETALETRMRRALGLGEVITKAEANDQLRGSVLGLMKLDGTITRDQYDAGHRYAEIKWRYHKLTGIPFPSARAQNLFSVHGFDGDVSESRALAARAASNQMMECEGWLLCKGVNGRPRIILDCVNNVCVLDIEEARLWPEHMISLLKRGLMTLQGGFQGKIESVRKAS